MKSRALAVSALIFLSLASAPVLAKEPETLVIEMFEKDGRLVASGTLNVLATAPLNVINEISYPYIKACFSPANEPCETGTFKEGVFISFDRLDEGRFRVNIKKTALTEISTFTTDDGQTIELPQTDIRQVSYAADFNRQPVHAQPFPGGGKVVITALTR